MIKKSVEELVLEMDKLIQEVPNEYQGVDFVCLLHSTPEDNGWRVIMGKESDPLMLLKKIDGLIYMLNDCLNSVLDGRKKIIDSFTPRFKPKGESLH